MDKFRFTSTMFEVDCCQSKLITADNKRMKRVGYLNQFLHVIFCKRSVNTKEISWIKHYSFHLRYTTSRVNSNF